MSEEVKEENSKTRRKFEQSLSRFTAILGGKEMFRPLKLLPEHIKAAVAELVADEKELLVNQFKNGARALIQKKREHDKHVAQARKEFEKKEEESMKAFVAEADALEKILDKVGEIEQEYVNTLSSIVKTPENGGKDEDHV